MAVSRVDFPQPFKPSKPYRLPQHAHKISPSSSNHHDSADEHTTEGQNAHAAQQITRTKTLNKFPQYENSCLSKGYSNSGVEYLS
jgi:hypothetical protein